MACISTFSNESGNSEWIERGFTHLEDISLPMRAHCCSCDSDYNSWKWIETWLMSILFRLFSRSLNPSLHAFGLEAHTNDPRKPEHDLKSQCKKVSIAIWIFHTAMLICWSCLVLNGSPGLASNLTLVITHNVSKSRGYEPLHPSICHTVQENDKALYEFCRDRIREYSLIPSPSAIREGTQISCEAHKPITPENSAF